MLELNHLLSIHIISFKLLREYFEKEPKSKAALVEWHSKIKKAEWKNFADMRKTFNSVDNVGNDRFVFNIKGNQYRIVAIVIFKIKKVYIRWIGNHNQYDRLKEINEL